VTIKLILESRFDVIISALSAAWVMGSACKSTTLITARELHGDGDDGITVVVPR